MIKSVEVKLSLLHSTVVAISAGDQVIGYIAKTENAEKPHALVSPSGHDVGEFDCPQCAIDAAVRAHFDIPDDTSTEFEIKGRTSPKKLLLLALLMMLAEE